MNDEALVREVSRVVADTIRGAAPWVTAMAGGVRADTKSGDYLGAQVVTEVDRSLQDLLLAAVAQVVPGICPIVEEETPISIELARRAQSDWQFVCDPIDGTLGFIEGRHDFVSMYALLNKGRPCWGGLATFYPSLQFHSGRCASGSEVSASPHAPLTVCGGRRLFAEEMSGAVDALRDAGCEVVGLLREPGHPLFENDNPLSGWGLGSTGATGLALTLGKWDALVFPAKAVHDVAGPWCLASSRGLTVRQYKYHGKYDPRWERQDSVFLLPEPLTYIKDPSRVRVVMAKSVAVADRLERALSA